MLDPNGVNQRVDFDTFSRAVSERIMITPRQLFDRLTEQKKGYTPVGFMMLECVDMSSSSLGHRGTRPYGPNNAYKEIPNHPISMSGERASDQSVVRAILLAEDLPDTFPESLNDWVEPPPPVTKKKTTRKK